MGYGRTHKQNPTCVSDCVQHVSSCFCSCSPFRPDPGEVWIWPVRKVWRMFLKYARSCRAVPGLPPFFLILSAIWLTGPPSRGWPGESPSRFSFFLVIPRRPPKRPIGIRRVVHASLGVPDSRSNLLPDQVRALPGMTGTAETEAATWRPSAARPRACVGAQAPLFRSRGDAESRFAWGRGGERSFFHLSWGLRSRPRRPLRPTCPASALRPRRRRRPS